MLAWYPAAFRFARTRIAPGWSATLPLQDYVSELKQRQQKGYVPTVAFVNAYLALGDNEQAFAWLERAFKEHSPILLYVKVHPFLDPLRGDPRLADLVRRVGLPETSLMPP